MPNLRHKYSTLPFTLHNEDFLGSEWTRGRVLCIVLEVHVLGLKHNRLEPDG
jgi:hypothetical protein